MFEVVAAPATQLLKPPQTVAPTIALLEDDASLSRLISTILVRHGYSVVPFSTIAEARKGLNAVDWDLLLCDRRVPDGDGIELCHELRESGAARNRYIIVMTGDGSEASKLEGFNRGADDYIIKPMSLPEMVARVRAGLRIVALQKALIESNHRLERIARIDSLTGLLNRRSFSEELANAFEHALRYDRPLALLMLDIDFFKNVNDQHGHQAGDDVLQTFGRLVAQSMRTSDMAARFGGEEFCVILPETQLLPAMQVAEKLRRAIEAEHISTAAGTVTVTASIGVVSVPHSRFSHAKALLDSADKALYRAKRAGRNRVEMEKRTDPQRTTRPSPQPMQAAI